MRRTRKIAALRAEKASLQQVKQDVDKFESEKAVLQQRIDVIETLQKNRTGGQELLQMVANTVVRVDQLWLTSMSRNGRQLDIAGEAGSINAVANFITQLKRIGLFRQGGNQGRERKRPRAGGADIWLHDDRRRRAMRRPAQAQPQAGRLPRTPPQPAAKGRS